MGYVWIVGCDSAGNCKGLGYWGVIVLLLGIGQKKVEMGWSELLLYPFN